MAARRLVVEVVGDASQLERTFRSASRSANVFNRSIQGAERQSSRSFRGIVAGSAVFSSLGRSVAFASTSFLGGVGLAAALRSVVSETSRVQEETEKTSVVFAQNARQVQAWSKTLTASFGISEGAALEAAGVFGNMLRPLGFAPALAAKMSERLVQLAADMASFNNASPEEVLQGLQSGLAGQVRPLRRYGVFLSEARIEEEAFADGITKAGSKLTQQQKVLAAYNIIIKDTKLQQGDVARNTGSLSVAMSKLHAGIETLEASIGRALLPELVNLTNAAARWFDKTKNQARVTATVTGVLSALGATLRVTFRAGELLYRGLEKLRNLFHSWKPVIVGVTAALVALGLLNPWLALAAGAVFVISHWRQVKTFFHNLGREIVQSFRYVWYRLEQGALHAALAVVEPFSHLPSFLGGWARTAKDRMQNQLNKLHPPNMHWGGYAAKAGHDTGKAWREAFDLEVGDVFRRAERRRRHHGDPYGTDTPTTKSAAASGAAAADRAAQGFTLPYRLRLAEAKARATATVADDLKVARAIRRYILSRLRHLHGEKLIEAYDLLAQENQEIAADVRQAAEHAKKAHEHTRKAVDTWKQLNTRLLTAGLGLSAAQRKALRERLSQIGPGGTVSGGGTGAAGYVIDPNTGRPGDVYMDGKKVGKVVHRHQQRDRKRNPRQRRGPHAAGAH